MSKDTRPHIGLFGQRNYGKSSIINKLTGQEISIVSEIAGTTTDPVKKTLEIFGLGPVVLIDTAGIDDFGTLGEKRIKKTLHAIKSIDLAIIVLSNNTFEHHEERLIEELNKFEVPFFFVHNKSDLKKIDASFANRISKQYNTDIIDFSTLDASEIEPVVALMKKYIPESVWQKTSLFGNLVKPNDIVLLVCPIDSEAPEGRLILPQVQAIRDAIDNDCVAIVLKETEVEPFLAKTGIKPDFAVVDSSIFKLADKIIPKNVPLTGFSILLARYRGPFEMYIKGTPALSKLKDDDRILMLESCTHQTSCDDIGRFKLPNWINQYSGKKLEYDVVAGLSELTRPITDYAMLIQCGGCMITRKQVHSRLKSAIDAGIPITNYGMAIAYIMGIYDRAMEPFLKLK